MSTPLARYGAVQVTTSSPGQILVMLYDGMFRFLREAHDAMTRNDRARAGERISRAHAILEQLLVDLRPEQAPALCANLEMVYRFCMQHIVQANITRDPAKIQHVMEILSPLRDAWREAAREVDVHRHTAQPRVAHAP